MSMIPAHSQIRIPTTADFGTRTLWMVGTRILFLLTLIAAMTLSSGAQISKKDRMAMRTRQSHSAHHEGDVQHSHAAAVPVFSGTHAQKADAELVEIERQAARAHVQADRSSKVRGRVPALPKEPVHTANKNSQMDFQYRPPKSGLQGNGGGRSRNSAGNKVGVRLR